jgi:hypothetical protein
MEQTKTRTQEKLTDKVRRLSEELEATKRQIRACKHSFSEPTRAYREYHEPIFVRYEGHGSDPEPVYDWVPRTASGWQRICGTCGYSEYTENTKVVEVKREPDFSDLTLKRFF